MPGPVVVRSQMILLGDFRIELLAYRSPAVDGSPSVRRNQVGLTHLSFLVDDIDAGLHHRVMAHMWAMVIDTARRRDLQVFATTHSIDCITALRRACIDAPERASEIRVVRLVKGGGSGITFTADELDTAIEGEVEVRG